MVQLYLDCDGVLADFDRGGERVLGLKPKAFEQRHGIREFWKRLAREPGYFENLPEIADARTLFEAVKHLEPIILTGCPMGGWAEAQKERWAHLPFPGTPLIACMARDKRNHCSPGDILVDDQLKHRERWEEAGGVFVHHRSAADTIRQLREGWPELFPD
ncbi:MAG TPA: hypothetical protein VGB49_05010 [Caulobacteraceae bacterium]